MIDKKIILWFLRAAALVSAGSLVLLWLGIDNQPPAMVSILMIAVWAFSEFERIKQKGRG